MGFDYNFFMPARVITGRGCVRESSGALALGERALIVTGGSAARRSGALEDVTAVLEERGVSYTLFSEILPNPTTVDCERAACLAREQGADFVVGIGGGSPLDAAKAIAVLAANEGLGEDIFQMDWKEPALPIALVGTTAGTGSEISPFSVLKDGAGRKRSLGCKQTYATVSFGDPTYTEKMPLSVTLPTTLDALCHAVEAYFAASANQISDWFSLEAIRMLIPAYRALSAWPEERPLTEELRDTLYYASLMAGYGLNHCGTCYSHVVGYFLSEEYEVPHGYACVAFLPHFLERSEQYLPEKAARFYSALGLDREKLLTLASALYRWTPPNLTQRDIDTVAARWYRQVPGNFPRSPGGFTGAEAKVVLEKYLLGDRLACWGREGWHP